MTSYLTSRLVSRFSHKASLIPSFRFPLSSFSSGSIAFTQKPEENGQKDTERKTVSLPSIHEDLKHEKKSEESTNKEFRISSSSSSTSSDVQNLINGVDTVVQRLKREPAYQVDNLTEDEFPLEIIDISDEKGAYYEPDRYMVKIKAPGEDIEAIVDVHDGFSSADDSDREQDLKPIIIHIQISEYLSFLFRHSEFNGAVEDFLAAKGINRSMFDKLIKCVKRKQYLAWLESVKDFAGN